MAPKSKRSVDERIQEIDSKIEKKEAELAALKAQREKLLHPLSMRDVLSKAKEAGMDPHEVAEKLGLEI